MSLRVLLSLLIVGMSSCCGVAAYGQSFNCDNAEEMNARALGSRSGGDLVTRIQSLKMSCELERCQGVKGEAFVEKLIGLVDLCPGVAYSLDDEEQVWLQRADGEWEAVKGNCRELQQARGREASGEDEDVLQQGCVAKSVLAAAGERLKTTGLFEEVRVTTEEVAGGYDVNFVLRGVTVIREVEFVGLDLFAGPLLKSEVERRLQLSPGQVLEENGREALLKKRAAALASLYSQRGYRGTEVKIALESTGEGSGEVRVKVKIKPGRKMVVRRVYIKQSENAVMSYDDLKRLLLKPIGWFGFFTKEALTKGVENILEAYRKLGYYGARVVYKGVKYEDEGEEGVGVDVFLNLDEGRKWELEFKGNRAFSDAELLEQVTFVEAGYIDNVEIENTLKAVRAFYETAGYYFVKVAFKVETLSQRSRRLTFTLKEGDRMEIRDIKILGDSDFDEASTLSLMRTRPFGILPGFLQRAQIEADLETIVGSFQSKGYMLADVPEWRVKAESKELFVEIDVREGVRTKISDVKLLVFDERGDVVTGRAEVVSETEIRDAMKRLRGGYGFEEDDRWFSMPWLSAVRGMITSKYQSVGFPNVNVRAKCRMPGQEGLSWDSSEIRDCSLPLLPKGCLPQSDGQRVGMCRKCEGGTCCRRLVKPTGCRPTGGVVGSAVELGLIVEMRERLYVGEVFLKGNVETNRDVIMRELEFKQGELFSLQKILKSQSNLRGTQLFESVSMETIGASLDGIKLLSTRNQAAVIVALEEGESLFYDQKGGIEARDILSDAKVFVSMESALLENNVWGQGQQMQLRFKYAFDPNTLETSNLLKTEEKYIAGEATFRDPRFVPALRVDLSTTLFGTMDLLGVGIDNFDQVEFGLRPAVRKAFPEQFISTELELEVKRTTTRSRIEDPRTLEGEWLFEPWRNTLSVSPRFSYDKRDSPFNPKRGHVFDIELNYTFSIFDAPTQFVKLVASWSQFFSFPRSSPKTKRLVVGYQVLGGQVLPLGETKEIPADELFRLGGVSSLRGFDDGTVGPKDLNFQPMGGELQLLGHTELRFPLFADITGFYFFDTGLLVDCMTTPGLGSLKESERVGCYEDIEWGTDLRYSTGMGLRYLISGLIPVGVDYGIILNRQVGEPFGQLHGNLGYTF